MTVTWTWFFWLWLAGLLLVFLPLELYAAGLTPGRGDTFSEFIWWAFGVRRRVGRARVPYAHARRFILAGMCISLTLHFVLGVGPAGVIVFGIGCGGVMLYAVLFERKRR